MYLRLEEEVKLINLSGKLISIEQIDPKTREYDGIIITTDNGRFVYYAVGDCCSTSWIEHLEVIPDVCGSTLNNITTYQVEDEVVKATLTLGQNSNYSEDNYIQIYRYAFITNRGQIDVELRNQSNGYYSGSLELSVAIINGKELDTVSARKLING